MSAGWFSNLFLTSKTAEKVVDGAINAGDKLFFTSEEKEESKQKIRDWYINLLDALKPHNIAMRTLAFGVFAAWFLHLVLSSILYMLSVFFCDLDVASCIFSNAALAIDKQMTDHINSPFAMIIMFYFGAAGVNSAIATYRNEKK